MDWVLILIGNLIMDSTIALFAVLVALDSHYLRICNEGKISKGINEQMYEGYLKRLPKLDISDSISKVMEEVYIDRKKSIEKDIDSNYNKSRYFNPFTTRKIIIISLFFVFGIILQIEGILL